MKDWLERKETEMSDANRVKQVRENWERLRYIKNELGLVGKLHFQDIKVLLDEIERLKKRIKKLESELDAARKRGEDAVW